MSIAGPRPPVPGEHPTALGPLVVTDLELAVLLEAHLRSLGERGQEGWLGEDATSGGADEALLSLVARGFLDHDGELSDSGELAALLTTVLDVRLAADLVLAVERVVMAGPTDPDATAVPDVLQGTRLVHVLDSGACVEDLLPDGSHHLYLLLDREDVVPWVTAVTVPADAAAGTGPALSLPPGRPEEIPVLLGRPSVLAELSVHPSGEDALEARRDGTASRPHHLLGLGRSGCWVTVVHPGRPLPGSVVFRPVDPGWVGRWVRSAMAWTPGPDAGRPDGGGAQGTMCG